MHPEERGYCKLIAGIKPPAILPLTETVVLYLLSDWGTRFTDTRKIFCFCPENLPQNAELSVDRDGDAFEVISESPQPVRLAGISAQQWSETVRTDAQWESMLFPRLLAVSERAWHTAEWELKYEQGRRFKHADTEHTNVAKLEEDWCSFARRIGQYELPYLVAAGWSCWLPPPGAQLQTTETSGHDSPRRLYRLVARSEFPSLQIQYCLCPGNPHSGDQSLQDGPSIQVVVDSTSSSAGARMGIGVSGAAGGAFVARAKQEAAAAGLEPLGARPPDRGVIWSLYDPHSPAMVVVDESAAQAGGVTVWLRTVVGELASRPTALVAL